MKQLLFSLVFLFLAACGSDDSSGENGRAPDLNVTLDTVQIDARGEILFLNTGLRSAVLTDDKHYLYNLNRQAYTIEKIDLTTLALETLLPFEKEGPDGIGGYSMGIRLVDGDRFLLSGYGNHALFDSNGKKLADVGPETIPSFASETEVGNVLFPVRLPETRSAYAGVYIIPGEREPQLMFWDTEEQTYRKVRNPLLEKSIQYQTDFDDGTTAMFISGGEYLEVVNDRVFLGLNGSSDLYIREPGQEEFYKKTFENGWIPREKETTFPEKINDRALFQELYKKATEEISYNKPIWDESREVYFRFSYKQEFGVANTGPSDGLFPRPTGASVYLSIYDADFNLLRETAVPELDQPPAYHFAKDGKIWIFENIEDEMGFVRLSFDL
ncbi:protein of unknown function [Cyclobacterium xiamenense]|uniref:DUF4221 domain-containing protein n=1 Tax=Cyclobacterium xiamenense TaxID=1297121 RepID=A0A1H6Y0H8_9BACT|nr:DUF4221 family protein [Cyclobacterium xiamenense]SEJ30642.1 protein of unknown function [Cyclobacterium xiamenense]